MSAVARYVNWALNRRSPWHRSNDWGSKTTLCGKTMKNHPEWSHAERPMDRQARFCGKCETEAVK